MRPRHSSARKLAPSTVKAVARRLNALVLGLNSAAFLWFGGHLAAFWMGLAAEPDLSPFPWMPNVVWLAGWGVLVGVPLHVALRR